jgi:hypothetical protein
MAMLARFPRNETIRRRFLKCIDCTRRRVSPQMTNEVTKTWIEGWENVGDYLRVRTFVDLKA